MELINYSREKSIIYINQFLTPTFPQLPKQKKKEHRRGSGEQGSSNGANAEVNSKILFKNILKYVRVSKKFFNIFKILDFLILKFWLWKDFNHEICKGFKKIFQYF